MIDILYNGGIRLLEFSGNLWNFLSQDISNTGFGSVINTLLGLISDDFSINGPLISWVLGSGLVVIFIIGLIK